MKCQIWMSVSWNVAMQKLKTSNQEEPYIIPAHSKPAFTSYSGSQLLSEHCTLEVSAE